MKKLQRPNLRVSEVREACENSMRDDVDLRKRLNSVSAQLNQLERNYESHGSAKTWFLIPEQSDVANLASKEDMAEAYSRLRSRRSCRGLYQQIQLASAYDDCPFCGEREVKTLDHYLPKAKHPGLAITPVNLVPSCYPCNNSKNAGAVTKADKQLLHPYYDDVSSEQWLFASVVVSSPASFVFYVGIPSAWDLRLQRRIIHHFGDLNLNELYAKRAARRLAGIRGKLHKHLYLSGGQEKVREDMQSEADSRYEAQKNSWETAFYQACAASDWFCDGGFLEH